jgi:uncharacterized surface protein with fasciclin (FAS1) repeats
MTIRLLLVAAISLSFFSGLALVASFRPATRTGDHHRPCDCNRRFNQSRGSGASEKRSRFRRVRYSTAAIFSGQNDLGEIQSFLSGSYPEFYDLVDKNEELWKKLGDADSFTLFAVNGEALAALGEVKRKQLDDPRNGEAREKIGLYHCASEAVSAQELFDCGGVITLGGTVPVERTRKGGIFGVGGNEDGGVTVGGSRVVRSTPVGTGVVHETDGLVSPAALWRYVDQLRIPGSK